MIVRPLRGLLFAAALAGAPAMTACDDDPPAAASATHVCPMHPARTGKAGDKCPDCGMDLVPK